MFLSLSVALESSRSMFRELYPVIIDSFKEYRFECLNTSSVDYYTAGISGFVKDH